jgi:hypothetical protein
MNILLIVDHASTSLPLERLVHEILGPGEISVYCTDGYRDPSVWLEANPAGLIVADPGRTGLDWLADRPREAGRTVVVADDPGVAVRAFEHGVADFVVRPLERDRFARALARAGGVTESALSPRLEVRKAGRIELVPVSDLLYVQGADNYAEMVLRDGRRELHDASLTRLAARLPGDFSRVHKSYLVRLSLVRRIRARGAGHYALELSTGDVIPVGRTHYRTVREQLLAPGPPARRWSQTSGAAA